jgi:hypothetical protein
VLLALGDLVGGQELERDLGVGPPRHDQRLGRDLVGVAAQDGLERLGEDVAPDLPGLDQGAVDVPEDQAAPHADYRLASSARWAAARPPPPAASAW